MNGKQFCTCKMLGFVVYMCVFSYKKSKNGKLY